MSAKSCILDPIPGVLMRDCFDVLLPVYVITQIVNLSLDNAIVPMKFKEATLNPIIKKESLDHELFSSFWPISNLSFVSKATEKVVATRLDSYLKDADFTELFQSAYKAGYSTETALILVQNDILCAIDDGQCITLVLLDLSAAFVTVDHEILLDRLLRRFGIKGKAISWLRSYLLERKQFVCVDNKRSSSLDLTCRIPQDSVLGPMLLTMYTAPLMQK